MSRAASRPASAGTGRRARRHRALDGVRRARSPRSPRARPRGCDALSAGSLTTIAGRTPGSEPSAPAARRCTAVISAARQRRRDRGDARPRAGAARRRAPSRCRSTRPPPSATSSSPVDVVEQLAGELVDAAGARSSGPSRARSTSAGAIASARERRQQDVAVAERRQRGVERAAPEVDRALAVLPVEARGWRHLSPAAGDGRRVTGASVPWRASAAVCRACRSATPGPCG